MVNTNTTASKRTARMIEPEYRDEIERAIDNLKRSALDRWFRREWHKAAARNKWSQQRSAAWRAWRKGRRGK